MFTEPVVQLVTWGLAILGLVGAAVIRDRYIMKEIRDGDDKLHTRINDVRDDYVRREDFNAHVNNMQKTMDDIRVDMREQRSTAASTHTLLQQLVQILGATKH